nr:helix-turn-helix domain-containing protein [uncultured Holophaga sp.]
MASDRVSRKRSQTRIRLLKAAYEVFSRQGLDATTIQEITERADVGLGTFYNYFASKEEIATRVLDCVIHDVARRNDIATAPYKVENPLFVQPTSIRLTIREAITNPIWQWWIRHPDLLADRMREGFRAYGQRDMNASLGAGSYKLDNDDMEMVWVIHNWIIVGGLRDILILQHPIGREAYIVELIMRIMGVPSEKAREAASIPLPAYPPPDIDFSFRLDGVVE